MSELSYMTLFQGEPPRFRGIAALSRQADEARQRPRSAVFSHRFLKAPSYCGNMAV